MMSKEDYYSMIDNILLGWNLRNDINVKVGVEVFTLPQCIVNYNTLTNWNCAEELKNIMINKNKDYTWDNEDPFYNFNSYRLVWVEPEDWIKTRIVDKVSRIKWLLSAQHINWAVNWESLADSWMDLWAYILILYLYVLNKEDDKNKEELEHTVYAETLYEWKY